MQAPTARATPAWPGTWGTGSNFALGASHGVGRAQELSGLGRDPDLPERPPRSAQYRWRRGRTTDAGTGLALVGTREARGGDSLVRSTALPVPGLRPAG